MRQVYRNIYLISGFTVIFLLGLIYGFGFSWLKVPLMYADDGLFEAGIIKNSLENPWYLYGHRLGFPNGLSFIEYPFVASLHIFFLKAIGFFTSDYILVTNIYYVLTFIFSSWTMIYFLRYLKIDEFLSFTGGILFSFLYYHFERNTMNLWLSAYFMVPLIMVCLFEITGSAALDHLACRSKKFLFSVGLLTGFGDLYYSYFSFWLLLLCTGFGIYNKGLKKTYLKSFALGAGLTLAISISLLPSLVHLFQERKISGSHVLSRREPIETENQSLRVIQLILPRLNHPIQMWREASLRFATSTKVYASISLGIMGSLGFFILIGFLFAKRSDGNEVFFILSRLNLMCLMVGTVGGLGTFISYNVVSAFRANCRICIYISCLCLTSFLFFLDSFYRKWVPLRQVAIVSVILIIGLIDQAYNPTLVPIEKRISAQLQKDLNFFQSLEAELPAGMAIAQWPSLLFPEGAKFREGGELPYTQLIPFLSSDKLKWSFGSPMGSTQDLSYRFWDELVDNWYTSKDSQWLEMALASVQMAGFKGLMITSHFYEDEGKSLRKTISALLKSEPQKSGGSKEFDFYDLKDKSEFSTKISETIKRDSPLRTSASTDQLMANKFARFISPYLEVNGIFTHLDQSAQFDTTIELRGEDRTYEFPVPRTKKGFHYFSNVEKLKRGSYIVVASLTDKSTGAQTETIVSPKVELQ